VVAGPRGQAGLPLSLGFPNVDPALAFNTAASFVTNTNWQAYSGEATMGHLVQMAGLAVQNFLSAAVGIVVAVALVRGFVRSRTDEQRIRDFFHDQALADEMVTRLLKPELEDVTMKNRLATARVVWQPRGYDPNLHKWLHRIDVPTLLVWGANDQLFPKDYAFAWQRLIPGSKVVIVPECGHVPHVEKPSVFVSELQSFINGMRAAA